MAEVGEEKKVDVEFLKKTQPVRNVKLTEVDNQNVCRENISEMEPIEILSDGEEFERRAV